MESALGALATNLGATLIKERVDLIFRQAPLPLPFYTGSIVRRGTSDQNFIPHRTLIDGLSIFICHQLQLFHATSCFKMHFLPRTLLNLWLWTVNQDLSDKHARTGLNSFSYFAVNWPRTILRERLLIVVEWSGKPCVNPSPLPKQPLRRALWLQVRSSACVTQFLTRLPVWDFHIWPRERTSYWHGTY